MLPDLVSQIVSTVNGIDIDKMTVIDAGGDGSALPSLAKQLPSSVIAIAEQIETATGVDIMGPLRERMANGGGSDDNGSSDSDQPALSSASESSPEQIEVPDTEIQTAPGSPV